MNHIGKAIRTLFLSASLGLVSLYGPVYAADTQTPSPIVLKTMGSLFFGGTVTQGQDGETFHGDHGYAQFYIPENARQYPLILWHGIGQSGRSWESTPDGREGFQAILPRRGWSVYIIDQPRRGRAGRTQSVSSGPAIPTTAKESSAWNAFRNGLWLPPEAPFFFRNTQSPTDPASVEQFFRQQTPDTGDEPSTQTYRCFLGNTMADLLRRTGPAILVTHSNSGQYGWFSGMAAASGDIKAIVSFEPGAFVFPEGDLPAAIPSPVALVNQRMEPRIVSQTDFDKLTQIPILIIYGDHIATSSSHVFNSEIWRVASARAKQFVDTVNRHGGDARLVMLPELGIKGNTHAMFADLNNLEIADILEKIPA